MSLSDRLNSRLQQSQQQRAVRAAVVKKRSRALSWASLALVGTGFAVASQLPPVPASLTAPTPVTTPAPTVTPAVPAQDISDVAGKGQKCVPYASNGTYLPELCGEYDAFSDKAARTARPEAWSGVPAEYVDALKKRNEQDRLEKERFWAEQNRRESEKRADCRAGRIDRDTCDRLVWDWETRM